jgi:hypothetical protein
MTRGVKGSGPNSKYNADGTLKKQGTEALTDGRHKTTTKRTATKRTTAKRAAAKRTATSRTRTARVVVFTSINVGDDGNVTLVQDGGQTIKGKLARPSMLLDLADDAGLAAQNYIASR